MNAAKRRAIFKRLRAANPQPRTELTYRTPYELLVAVVLSAQATDRSVNLATQKLYPVAATPQSMVRLGVAGLAPYINSIGLWRNKAKNVVALSQMLIERHGGDVPATREALEALPGVGRKTANVVLNTAFGQPTIAVDTHIFRVANRTGLALGANVVEVENRLEKFVPEEFRHDCHHWLILHGRYICTARAPKCGECVIVDLCEYRHKNLPKDAPVGAAAREGRRTAAGTPAGHRASPKHAARTRVARPGRRSAGVAQAGSSTAAKAARSPARKRR